MKTIGLIGGMSRESSLEYYRIINEQVKEKLGGLHSAKSLMYSVDFNEIEKLQHQGNREKATQLMIDAAQRLEKGGADFVVICTNTMHKMANDVQENIRIPLLHIADATADRIRATGIRKIGLLGTRFTMEEDFYKSRLIDKYGFEVIIPDDHDRQIVHDIIYKELCLGKINKSSKDQFIRVINNLIANKVQAVILGCTEISLLVQQEDVDILLFDTTRIHAESAVELSLSI
jgi:aspartate racemase